MCWLLKKKYIYIYCTEKYFGWYLQKLDILKQKIRYSIKQKNRHRNLITADFDTYSSIIIIKYVY